MSKRGGGSLWLSFALAFSLLGTSLALCQEAPSLTQSLPMPGLLNPDGTVNWQALDKASQELSQTADEAYLSANELQSKLEDLRTQYTNLLSSVKEADLAQALVVRKLLVHRDVWMGVGLVSTGMAVGGLVGDWRSAAWGAGGGALTFVIFEAGRMFRLWR